MGMDHVALKTDIPIRRPTLELTAAIPRHWHGCGPFATHFLNALSSTFPFGEAFFVRSVQHYRESVDDPVLRAQIRGFAGQEGQHSRLHDVHVELLIAQGYSAIATRNRFGDLATRWQNRHFPKISLAMTAALEHLTALLARQILGNPEKHTGSMHPEMAKLWRWHALEEAEHKAVAYDVLMQISRSQLLRITNMIGITLGLMIEVTDRMVYMLWKDGLLFKAETWSEGRRFLFGDDGFLRGLGRDYRAWFRKDFHPDDIDDRLLINANASVINAELAISRPA